MSPAANIDMGAKAWIYLEFFFPPCCGAVCPLWKSFKWLPGTWRKKNRFCWGFFWYLTNRRICNAGGREGLTHRVYFFLSSPPRRSHRQLCKEDGEEEWWAIHPGCPSSVPAEEAAESSGFERPREGIGVTLVAALLPLPGQALCVWKMPKDWQESRETSAVCSVRENKHNLPSAAASRENFPSFELCCCSGNNFDSWYQVWCQFSGIYLTWRGLSAVINEIFLKGWSGFIFVRSGTVVFYPFYSVWWWSYSLHAQENVQEGLF